MRRGLSLVPLVINVTVFCATDALYPGQLTHLRVKHINRDEKRRGAPSYRFRNYCYIILHYGHFLLAVHKCTVCIRASTALLVPADTETSWQGALCESTKNKINRNSLHPRCYNSTLGKHCNKYYSTVDKLRQAGADTKCFSKNPEVRNEHNCLNI